MGEVDQASDRLQQNADPGMVPTQQTVSAGVLLGGGVMQLAGNLIGTIMGYWPWDSIASAPL